MGKIIFILGGSGLGKTESAKKLAADFGLKYYSIDDFRKSRQNFSQLHFLINNLLDDQIYLNKTAEELLIIHQKISQEVYSMYQNTIVKIVQKKEKAVIEGDDLPPKEISLLIRRNLQQNIRAVCLYTKNKKVVFNNICERDHLNKQHITPLLQKQLEHAFLNGQRIAKEAKVNNLSLVASSKRYLYSQIIKICL